MESEVDKAYCDEKNAINTLCQISQASTPIVAGDHQSGV